MPPSPPKVGAQKFGRNSLQITVKVIIMASLQLLYYGRRKVQTISVSNYCIWPLVCMFIYNGIETLNIKLSAIS
jgi:hypothetical protein